ncbi:nuclear transport factor 2 family protein [Sphingomonas sp. AR_OL41]|jgi:ketosteroid isomerase-like protein|uniref:nuclear transport factor 2 family protein n=1 Tax=Sphingomonas sp. AR_OL41 TaxID=3042729 RepID=UPI0024818171|nr:nuclear transport factor 2 family protein [Sphingomonas sp. AR_OL41]MDH7971726.1 nuclear transport factor 2 family protein [Sphingomonas sp. AR_OL41]
MPFSAMFRHYVDAFNAGDDVAYSRFYAPDVVFCNGAGAALVGARAIVDYYARFRQSVERVMTVEALLCAETCIAAALASRFTILQDGTSFANDVLNAGDRVEINSMALYEMAEGRFASINATTLRRTIIRKENA